MGYGKFKIIIFKIILKIRFNNLSFPILKNPYFCLAGSFHRAQVRAELDACYARLYSLVRDELRYTLRVDPKQVHGEDFPGETFCVLKEEEIKQFGEYRTRRMVLESWDKLER